MIVALPPKTLWADVVLPKPPLRVLTYRIPDRFAGALEPGHRVRVPLGKRRVTGFVAALVSSCPVDSARDIEDILDPYPMLSAELLDLTRWVADYYFASWGDAIRAALPPGTSRESQAVVRSILPEHPESAPLSDAEDGLVRLLSKHGPMTLRRLRKLAGPGTTHFVLSRLERAGLVRIDHVFEEPVGRGLTRTRVSLRGMPAPEALESLRRRAPRQAGVLEQLQRLGGEVLREDLDVEIHTLRRLEQAGWVELWEEETVRDGGRDIEPEPLAPFPLTAAQSEVLSRIHAGAGAFGVFLIHGVTGSGKTRLYIEAVRNALDRGKDALVLIPEISLTPQAVARYRGAFGRDVAVLHSRLSAGERVDAWRRLREGQFRVALGPRSAVFAPLANLGIIVVDEEHESSYKQTDPAPRYHARDTAVVRGRMSGCPVLLGSATPSLESYFNAETGKYTLCHLPERVDRLAMPSVALVRPETDGKAKPVITPLLKDKIQNRLAGGEQTILLLNRRGYAPFLQCASCGAIDTCPHCAISLTFHRSNGRLQCHYCGFTRPVHDACPSCRGTRLQTRGMGTERIEEEIHALFPGIRLLRMDLDTTRKKGEHARILSAFGKRQGDILLGTQMVAKGHDFPDVTLVGIVSADTGLYFPDFRSGERTFQLLTQAAGRAGRKDKPGEVVIQTRTPEHPVLQFSKNHDFEAFYRWELAHRRELGYPPFGRLLLVRFKSADENKALAAAQSFQTTIGRPAGVQQLGPVPAPISKAKGQYRFHILFREEKSADSGGIKLRQTVRRALEQFQAQSRFQSVRVHVDVDPVDMM